MKSSMYIVSITTPSTSCMLHISVEYVGTLFKSGDFFIYTDKTYKLNVCQARYWEHFFFVGVNIHLKKNGQCCIIFLYVFISKLRGVFLNL